MQEKGKGKRKKGMYYGRRLNWGDGKKVRLRCNDSWGGSQSSFRAALGEMLAPGTHKVRKERRGEEEENRGGIRARARREGRSKEDPLCRNATVVYQRVARLV